MPVNKEQAKIAEEAGVELEDVKRNENGDWTIDGMDPIEWLYLVMGDDEIE